MPDLSSGINQDRLDPGQRAELDELVHVYGQRWVITGPCLDGCWYAVLRHDRAGTRVLARSLAEMDRRLSGQFAACTLTRAAAIEQMPEEVTGRRLAGPDQRIRDRDRAGADRDPGSACGGDFVLPRGSGGSGLAEPARAEQRRRFVEGAASRSAAGGDDGRPPRPAPPAAPDWQRESQP
jgi:hypothetical protein